MAIADEVTFRREPELDPKINPGQPEKDGLSPLLVYFGRLSGGGFFSTHRDLPPPRGAPRRREP